LQQTIKLGMICCKTINTNMTFCNPFFMVIYTKYGLLKNIHLSLICSKPSIFVGFAANHPLLYDLQQTVKLEMICCDKIDGSQQIIPSLMVCCNSIHGCYLAAKHPKMDVFCCKLNQNCFLAANHI
jgi:hypothetical protein